MTEPCNDPRMSALGPAREVAREKAHIRYGIDRGNGPGGSGRVSKRSLQATASRKHTTARRLGAPAWDYCCAPAAYSYLPAHCDGPAITAAGFANVPASSRRFA